MKRIKLKEDAFPVNDPEAYKAYPHLRQLFNKKTLSSRVLEPPSDNGLL